MRAGGAAKAPDAPGRQHARRPKMKMLCAALAMLTAAAAFDAASAAEIKVVGSPGFRGPYTELVPGFEKTTGNKVTTNWGGVNEVAKRVADGETADIVILPVTQIDELIARGKLLAPTRIIVAKSGVGVAVRAGATKIDISSSDG